MRSLGMDSLKSSMMAALLLAAGCEAAVDVEDTDMGASQTSSGATDSALGTSGGTPPDPSGGPPPGTDPSTTDPTTTGDEPGSDTAQEPLLTPGTYFAALTAVPVASSTPFQLLADITVDGNAMTLEFTYLSLDVLSTTSPREPVGMSFQVNDVSIEEDGAFSFPLALSIPGAANPITGSDIQAEVELNGDIVDGKLCAAVAGMVTVPANIDLTGSTFAAIPVDGPEARPDVATVVCD